MGGLLAGKEGGFLEGRMCVGVCWLCILLGDRGEGWGWDDRKCPEMGQGRWWGGGGGWMKGSGSLKGGGSGNRDTWVGVCTGVCVFDSSSC